MSIRYVSKTTYAEVGATARRLEDVCHRDSLRGKTAPKVLTFVWDYAPESTFGAVVHVNNPPSDSGFTHGKDMSYDEFVRRANAYISSKSAEEA